MCLTNRGFLLKYFQHLFPARPWKKLRRPLLGVVDLQAASLICLQINDAQQGLLPTTYALLGPLKCQIEGSTSLKHSNCRQMLFGCFRLALRGPKSFECTFPTLDLCFPERKSEVQRSFSQQDVQIELNNEYQWISGCDKLLWSLALRKQLQFGWVAQICHGWVVENKRESAQERQ